MAARYDADGNFIYPEGFDADSQEWRPGFETQREEWERQYAEAQSRFMAHRKQKEEAKAADSAAEDSPSDSPIDAPSDAPADSSTEEASAANPPE